MWTKAIQIKLDPSLNPKFRIPFSLYDLGPYETRTYMTVSFNSEGLWKLDAWETFTINKLVERTTIYSTNVNL